MSDGRRWLDKTIDSVKKASEAGVDLVQRNYRRAEVKVELASLRRSLDDVARDIGRVAVDRLREAGQVTTADVAHLLRRVDEFEDQVATQERRLNDLETDEPPGPTPPGPPTPGPDETHRGTRRPGFTSGGPPRE